MVSGELLFWAASFAATAAIVVPYAVAFRRRRLHDRVRLAEAVELGAQRAPAQRPIIDVTRCLGCGSCVPACPEGDVLGVVGGTATVVNGVRCVGHARCKTAGPIGAIEVGLGDLASRPDVPVLDRWQESTVPGLFRRPFRRRPAALGAHDGTSSRADPGRGRPGGRMTRITRSRRGRERTLLLV